MFSPFPFLIEFPRRVVGIDGDRSSTIAGIAVSVDLGGVNRDGPQGGDLPFMDNWKGSSGSTWKNPSTGTRAASLSTLVGVLKDARSSAMRIACNSVSIVDRITCNSVHAAVGGVIAAFTMVHAAVGGVIATFVKLAALGGVKDSFETVLAATFVPLGALGGVKDAFGTVLAAVDDILATIATVVSVISAIATVLKTVGGIISALARRGGGCNICV